MENQRLNFSDVRSLLLNRFNALSLVFLSACRTGIGNEEVPYGFASLAIDSGVDTVIASLWGVPDLPTAQFAAEFYKHLKVASTRSEALRQAQLALLYKDKNTGEEFPRLSHPYSGLVLPFLVALGNRAFGNLYDYKIPRVRAKLKIAGQYPDPQQNSPYPRKRAIIQISLEVGI